VRDLGTDPLELAADALQVLTVLIGCQVLGIRVVERADHPLDRALDEGVLRDRATGVAVR
jgi:hypothetical protein